MDLSFDLGFHLGFGGKIGVALARVICEVSHFNGIPWL